jgi:peptide/nickel transport system permease protein
MVFVVLGMTVIVFVVTHLIPADPAMIAAGEGADAEIIAAVRAEYGLDRPLLEQYWLFLKGLLRGNLGRSILTGRPVLDDIRERFPATLELALVSTSVALLLGVSMGIFSALSQDRLADNLIRLLSIVWVGMPAFWLALMFQILFYGKLEWLPFGGRTSIAMPSPPHITGLFTIDALLSLRFDILADVLVHLILPVTVLALRSMAELTRMTRSSMLEVMGEDYVRTARAKGLANRTVVMVHALKNAALPIITITGIQFGYALGGTVLIEAIFQWPGMGRYAVHSIQNVDFQAVIGVAVVISVVFVVVNLLVDVAYTFADPRIRY